MCAIGCADKICFHRLDHINLMIKSYQLFFPEFPKVKPMHYSYLILISLHSIKPGTFSWRIPGFLKIALAREVGMRVCVSAPEAINNCSCEMKL